MGESIIHILWGAFLIIILRLSFSTDKGVDRALDEPNQHATVNALHLSSMPSSAPISQHNDSASLVSLDVLHFYNDTFIFAQPYLNSVVRVFPSHEHLGHTIELDNPLYLNQLNRSFSSLKFYKVNSFN